MPRINGRDRFRGAYDQFGERTRQISFFQRISRSAKKVRTGETGRVLRRRAEKVLRNFILKQDQDIYYLLSKALFKSAATVRQHHRQTGVKQPSESPACELRMVKKDKTVFWVHLEMALEDMVGNSTVRSKLVNAIRAARRSSEVSGLMLIYLGRVLSNLGDEIGVG